MAQNTWDDNEIQFTRLLAEVNAVLTSEQVTELAASMDLSEMLVRSLFVRAELAFDRLKDEIA